MTASGAPPLLTRYAWRVRRSTIIALPATVGNVSATATTSTGTVTPLTVACTVVTRAGLVRVDERLVDDRRDRRRRGGAAVSVTCPCTGAGTKLGPTLVVHDAEAGVNVSVAPPGADCQPAVSGSAKFSGTGEELAWESSSPAFAAAVQLLVVAPPTVSLTGVLQLLRPAACS